MTTNVETGSFQILISVVLPRCEVRITLDKLVGKYLRIQGLCYIK